MEECLRRGFMDGPIYVVCLVLALKGGHDGDDKCGLFLPSTATSMINALVNLLTAGACYSCGHAALGNPYAIKIPYASVGKRTHKHTNTHKHSRTHPSPAPLLPNTHRDKHTHQPFFTVMPDNQTKRSMNKKCILRASCGRHQRKSIV